MQQSLRVSYSEEEAAQKLGVSVSRLRGLVRNHILDGVDEGSGARFYATDLMVLRALAKGDTGAEELAQMAEAVLGLS